MHRALRIQTRIGRGLRTDWVAHSIVGTATQSGVCANSVLSVLPGGADCLIRFRVEGDPTQRAAPITKYFPRPRGERPLLRSQQTFGGRRRLSAQGRGTRTAHRDPARRHRSTLSHWHLSAMADGLRVNDCSTSLVVARKPHMASPRCHRVLISIHRFLKPVARGSWYTVAGTRSFWVGRRAVDF